MKLLKGQVFTLFFVIAIIITGCGGGAVTNPQPNGGSGSTNQGASEQPKSDKVYTIDFNTGAFSSEYHYIHAIVPWAKMVEEKTGGRVKVNLYSNDTLGSVQTVLQDVEGGVYQAGVIMPHYFPDSHIYPLTITTLPFSLPSSDLAKNTKAILEFSEKYYDQIWTEAIPIGGATVFDPGMFSTKPIRGIEDLKNVRFRTQGGADSQVVKAWGANPVTLPYTEMYSGFQTGIIEALFFPISAAKDLKFDEVSSYMTKIAINRSSTIMIINKKFYNSLPQDIQTLFEDELNQAFTDMMIKAYFENQAMGDEWSTGAMKEVITLTEEQTKELMAPAKEAWDDWVEEANKRGYPGEEMMKDFREIIEKNGLPLPF